MTQKPDTKPGTGPLEGYVTWPGWDPHEDFLGPFYHRKDGDKYRTAFVVEQKHINGGGAVHGGLLMSFADHSIFVFAQDVLGARVSGVTITLNGEFVSAGQLGDFVESTGEVVRETRSLVFVRGIIHTGDTVLLNYSAIIKKPPQK
ncbi:MAG: PaaI family thioesterase [Alphaproteobacteria bacterium]|nr:MAG: PaaI family thioesterase [Alphaproteobacteria bacterium]